MKTNEFSVERNEHTDVYKVTLDVKIKRLNDLEGTYPTYIVLSQLLANIMNIIASPEREGVNIYLRSVKLKETFVTIPIRNRQQNVSSNPGEYSE